jgi:hypothetical protein
LIWGSFGSTFVESFTYTAQDSHGDIGTATASAACITAP